jgi:hypothetical protein
MNISAIKAVLSFPHRYRAGERMVIFSEYGIKVAVVASLSLVEPRRLAELVAQNRGVEVRIFLDLPRRRFGCRESLPVYLDEREALPRYFFGHFPSPTAASNGL